VGGDLLDPLYLDTKMDTKEKKKGAEDFKKMRDSAPRKSLQEILQWEDGSSGAPPRDTGTTSKPTAEVSAKGRQDKTVWVRKVRAEKSKGKPSRAPSNQGMETCPSRENSNWGL
jgi:hypothetical protein